MTASTAERTVARLCCMCVLYYNYNDNVYWWKDCRSITDVACVSCIMTLRASTAKRSVARLCCIYMSCIMTVSYCWKDCSSIMLHVCLVSWQYLLLKGLVSLDYVAYMCVLYNDSIYSWKDCRSIILYIIIIMCVLYNECWPRWWLGERGEK